jgi:hypothetical protein
MKGTILKPITRKQYKPIKIESNKMKTIPIQIKVISPEDKKISVIQNIPKDSQNPIATAFNYYTKGKDKRHFYSLVGEGAW